MTDKSYALIKEGSNFVKNIIIAPEGYNAEGFYMVETPDGTRCEAGMYYNSVDNLFYDKGESKSK